MFDAVLYDAENLAAAFDAEYNTIRINGLTASEAGTLAALVTAHGNNGVNICLLPYTE